MEPWVDLASRLGVPIALLAIVATYHVRVIREKDAELARINEMRVKESREIADKMVERDKTFLEMLGEVDRTLSMLLDRIK